MGCRQVEAKRNLIRIVRGPEQVEADPTGKLPGRGAYIHPAPECAEKAFKGPLSKALAVEIGADDQERLLEQIAQMAA